MIMIFLFVYYCTNDVPFYGKVVQNYFYSGGDSIEPLLDSET